MGSHTRDEVSPGKRLSCSLVKVGSRTVNRGVSGPGMSGGFFERCAKKPTIGKRGMSPRWFPMTGPMGPAGCRVWQPGGRNALELVMAHGSPHFRSGVDREKEMC